MTWHAETLHGQIAVGTELSIFETPWGAGLPVNSLPSGVTLTIQFTTGAVNVQVIEVSGSEAVIETSDQTKWRIEEVGENDFRYSPAHTVGAPATYWVVRRVRGQERGGPPRPPKSNKEKSVARVPP
jgi:hypothetical protein